MTVDLKNPPPPYVLAADRKDRWVDTRTGYALDPVANKFTTGPYTGKSVWFSGAPYQPTGAELAQWAQLEKPPGVFDYVKDPKGLIADTRADVTNAVSTVTSSASSLPEKIEDAGRAVLPFAAATAALYAPVRIPLRIGLAAISFVGAKVFARKGSKP